MKRFEYLPKDLRVPCPKCKAPIGERCRTCYTRDRVTLPHRARKLAADTAVSVEVMSITGRMKELFPGLRRGDLI